ncbi:hypothetical protein FOZ60_015844 [Perkinsus olseni]|uniref:Uncharacterized protein n=1 Tax=Perkinsus olseni TaxID=32597 RepID=A0A7J6P6D8_PEROL|nr:hypothetical protein FOZ60_015844 [Perkinsus olseni]
MLLLPLHHDTLHPAVVQQAGFSVVGIIDWIIAHINIYGRALAVDEAFRHLDEAHQYLLDGEKMQGSAPHTDVLKAAIHSTKLAKAWLKPYAVSSELAHCRRIPVCTHEYPSRAAALPLALLQGGTALTLLPNTSGRRTAAYHTMFA